MQQWFEKILINPKFIQRNNSEYKKAQLATLSTLVVFCSFVGYSLFFAFYEGHFYQKNISNIIAIGIFLTFFGLMRFSIHVNIPIMFINLSILPVLYRSIYFSDGLLSPDLGWILFTVATSTFFVSGSFGAIVAFISLIFTVFLLKDPTLIQVYANKNIDSLDYFFSWFFLIFIMALLLNVFTYLLNRANNRILDLNKRIISNLNSDIIIIQNRINQLHNELGKDFHDEMGNKLAVIGVLSESLIQRINNQFYDEKIMREASEIKRLAGDVIDGTRHFIWTLGTENQTLKELILYIHQFVENATFNVNIDFNCRKNELAEFEIRFTPFFNRQIILIVKEIITNTIKHAYSNSIEMQVNSSIGKLEISIADNGIGCTEKDLQSKHGIKNIRSRVKFLKGECMISNHSGMKYQMIFYTNNFKLNHELTSLE